MKRILGLTMAAVLGGMFALGAFHYLLPLGIAEQSENEVKEIKVVERERPSQVVSYPVSMNGEPLDFTKAADLTVHSVVHIETEVLSGSVRNDPWADMFGGTNPFAQSGSGSGVIISDDGYVVTNNHVIEGADRITLTLNDNRSYEAEVVGADPSFDLALLKVDAEELPFMSFGNSDNVRVGEWVLAVGNPFNLTSTVTAGIVSAKARNINLLDYDPNRAIFPVESFIQTDAAVNPGNSGGALVNTSGELIGINTAIASYTGSFSGYSFAVPSSIVSKVTKDLRDYGNVQRAYIGVSISDINQQVADEKDLDDIAGVYVRGLVPGGAAADVGILEGDIIKEVGGKTVSSVTELQERISTYRPGDNLEILVKRDNKLLSYDVVVRDRDGNTSIVPKVEEPAIVSLGAEFEALSETELESLNIKSGVRLKTDNDGKFRRAGIKDGFIITKIDKKIVTGPDDVAELLDAKEGGVLIEGLYPDGTVAYYGFGM